MAANKIIDNIESKGEQIMKEVKVTTTIGLHPVNEEDESRLYQLFKQNVSLSSLKEALRKEDIPVKLLTVIYDTKYEANGIEELQDTIYSHYSGQTDVTIKELNLNAYNNVCGEIVVGTITVEIETEEECE